MPKHEPQRSCLGCRQVRDKSELMRFVLSPEGEIVPDLLSKLPGRGAYTCCSSGCLHTAVAKKQFNRAFKGDLTSISSEELIRRVTALLEERVAAYVALANKAGQTVSGTDMVIDSLRKHQVGLIVLAKDVSPDIREKILQAAARAGVVHAELLDKDHLGNLLGKALRSAVAIMKGGFSETVIKELNKYRNFFEGGAQVR